MGKALCKGIDDKGWKAVIADRQEVLTASDAFPVDITSAPSLDSLIEAVVHRHGRIDAVVNAAYPRNKNFGRKFEAVTFEDFSENLSIHLGGYFLVMQKFALHFKRMGGGSIVNISSIYGVIPPRFEIYEGTEMTMPVEYAAIKSALIHLTKYAAKYFKGSNVRINCVSPGGILHNQPQQFIEQYSHFTLSKGMLESNDVAGAVLFLVSDDAKFINGQNIIVDDGFTL